MWVKFKWGNDLYRIRLMLSKKKKIFFKQVFYTLQIQQLNLDNDMWEFIYDYKFKNQYDYIKIYYDSEFSRVKIVSLKDLIETVEYNCDEEFKEFMENVGCGLIKIKEEEIKKNTRFRRRIGLL